MEKLIKLVAGVCFEILMLLLAIVAGCWIFEVPMITQRQFWGCFYILNVWRIYHHLSVKGAVGKVFGEVGKQLKRAADILGGLKE